MTCFMAVADHLLARITAVNNASNVFNVTMEYVRQECGVRVLH